MIGLLEQLLTSGDRGRWFARVEVICTREQRERKFADSHCLHFVARFFGPFCICPCQRMNEPFVPTVGMAINQQDVSGHG